jgi:hypothetical protein
MNQYIKPGQMLEAMKETLASGAPKPFTIGFLKADKTRKTAGQYRMLKCTLSSRGKKSGSTDKRIINIEIPGTKEIKTIHIDTIIYFNDKPTS